MTSTDPDAGSASSDPPQAGDDKTPPAKDKRRDHDDHKKHHRRHRPDVNARLRAREEQVDRALQKLLFVKGQALQLVRGARPDQHTDPQETPGDDDAPAADPQAPAAPQ